MEKSKDLMQEWENDILGTSKNGEKEIENQIQQEELQQPEKKKQTRKRAPKSPAGTGRGGRKPKTPSPQNGMSKLRSGAATQQKLNLNCQQTKKSNSKSKALAAEEQKSQFHQNQRSLSPVNGKFETSRSRSNDFFRKVDGASKNQGDDGEDDKRDTNEYGLIIDHQTRNKQNLNDPNAPKSPVYKIGRVLGSGMIGVACLCQDEKRNKLKCLKYMSIEKIREKNLFKNIKDEVQIMYELIGVDGVCQIEDIIINEDKDITIVLPFYALTDLWNYMKVKPGRHLNENDSRKVFVQLVHTFIGIHTRKIMHRDIKPENILVKNDDLVVCLSDFGLATRVGPQPQFEKTRTGQAGTPCYYSYEIVKKKPYDERVDIWCLGVLLFEMLFGALPFSHDPKDARDYTASISSLVFKFPQKSTVSQEARDLIGKILVPQEKRITLEQIKQHPWINLDLDLTF